MTLNERDVVAWLRQQADARFFEIVYEAAEGRGPDAHDKAWLESHVVVGYAYRHSDDGKATWSPWGIERVSLPRAPGAAPDDALLCEAGVHCGRELISWAKEIRCPVCGGDTYAT